MSGYAQGGGYWAGFARRKLEDSGAKYRGAGLVHSFDLPYDPDVAAPIELYFWDSVWCALTCAQFRYALRASWQVLEYSGRLGADMSRSDAVVAVRRRIEDWSEQTAGRAAALEQQIGGAS